MNSEDGGSMSRIADETDSDTEEDIEDDYGQQDPPTSSDESEEPPRRMADPFDMDEFLKDL